MSWKRIDDKTIFVEKGTLIPFMCPVCGKFSDFMEGERVIECSCGFTGTEEDFKGTEFVKALVH